ncbi:MAG: O-antigen ligase family protein [Psychromonas sp.]|nr:O-antigen ligase family protein [Psychromonas sp.]
MSAIGAKTLDGELLLRRAGFILLAFFFLIAFESKALMNAIGGLSLLASFVYIWRYDKKILQNNPYLLLFVVPYLIGFLLGFLSHAGMVGAFAFLDRFKFMLLVLPFAAFVDNRKKLHILLAMFFISAAVAICYGIYTKQPYGHFQGFYKIGRTADMMVVACLAALVYLVQSRFVMSIKTIGFKLLMALATAFFAWAVMMSEMRGSWLGLGIGLIGFICLLLLFNRKAFVFNIMVIICITISVIYWGNIRKNINRIDSQFESIVATQNNNSNEARLHLWKTGWDFSKEYFLFGSGAKQSKEMFVEFFNAQPDDYQKRYHFAIHYPGEYHNSYLQIYVETGVIFFFVYMLSVTYLLFIIFRNIRKVQFKDQKYLTAAVITSVAFMAIQFFHSELYSYGSAVFYLVLFSGCYVLNQNNQSAWCIKGHKK